MLNFHKYFQFFYLIIAGLFLYNGIEQITKGEVFWVSFLFCGMAVFMFFFKRKFAKKFEDHKKK
jgi:hypothetical protein